VVFGCFVKGIVEPNLCSFMYAYIVQVSLMSMCVLVGTFGIYICDGTYKLLVRTLVTAFSPHRSCAKARADSIWVIPYRDVCSTMIMPVFSLRP